MRVGLLDYSRETNIPREIENVKTEQHNKCELPRVARDLGPATVHVIRPGRKFFYSTIELAIAHARICYWVG